MNHPNRRRLYSVAIQSWSNSGLGWEAIPKDMGGVDARHDIARDQIAEIVAGREDIGATTVDVFRGDGELVAMAGRGDKQLRWI